MNIFRRKPSESTAALSPKDIEAMKARADKAVEAAFFDARGNQKIVPSEDGASHVDIHEQMMAAALQHTQEFIDSLVKRSRPDQRLQHVEAALAHLDPMEENEGRLPSGELRLPKGDLQRFQNHRSTINRRVLQDAIRSGLESVKESLSGLTAVPAGLPDEQQWAR